MEKAAVNISCERAALAVSDYGGHARGSFASEKMPDRIWDEVLAGLELLDASFPTSPSGDKVLRSVHQVHLMSSHEMQQRGESSLKSPCLLWAGPWATSHMWMHLCKSALSELVNPGLCEGRAWFLYFADLQWRYRTYFPIPCISACDSCMAREGLQGRAAPSFSPALRGPPLAPAARSALESVWFLLEQL